jgi:hypothetical protein
MQEIAFPGFKFQKFSGDYPSNNNDKLRLIFFFTFCAFFHLLFQIHATIVSINFRANLGAQNAGNGISVLQISIIFWGVHPHTRDHCYPPLISNDK